jgi:hypothetical protein
VSQETWERCLRKAADNGLTLGQAVRDFNFRTRRHRSVWPTGVVPLPLEADRKRQVAELWPEYTIKSWTSKEMF